MPRESTTRVEDVRQSSASSAQPSMEPEWANLISDAPARFSGALFGFMAKRLRVQAAFLEELASCRSTPEMIKRQMDFVGTAWRDISAEMPELWSAAQPNGGARKAPE